MSNNRFRLKKITLIIFKLYHIVWNLHTEAKTNLEASLLTFNMYQFAAWISVFICAPKYI